MSWIALAGYAGPILRILFFLDRIQRNLVVLPRSKNLLFHAWSYLSILILYTEIRQCSVPEAPSDDGMEYVKRPVAEPDPEEMILAEAIIPKIPPACARIDDAARFAQPLYRPLRVRSME